MLPKSFSTKIFDDISNKKAYLLLLCQLNKDFSSIGLENKFLENIKPKDLIHEMQNVLSELLQHDFQTFLNLLYRIDVSESKIKNQNIQDIIIVSKNATNLILEREWQKVWFKSKNL